MGEELWNGLSLLFWVSFPFVILPVSVGLSVMIVIKVTKFFFALVNDMSSKEKPISRGRGHK